MEANAVVVPSECQKDYSPPAQKLQVMSDRCLWHYWAFMLSCVGTSIGLGSFWRFPALVSENGGANFIVCYLVMVVAVAVPLYKLELGLALFSSSDIISLWKCFPLGKGIGMAFCYTGAVVSIYMSIILSYVVAYFFYSFTDTELPWSECDPRWGPDVGCYGQRDATRLCPKKRALVDNIAKLNFTNVAMLTLSNVSCVNGTRNAAEIYFYKRILGLSHSITTPGEFRIELALCVAVIWMLVYICVSRAAMGFGTVVIFFVPLPFAITVIFLGRAVTLRGANMGLGLLTMPSLHSFLNARVWVLACQHALFSFGLGMGTTAYLGSRYRSFDRSRFTEAFVVVNTVVANITGGLIAICTLGHLASTKGTTLPDAEAPGQVVPFVTFSALMTTVAFPKLSAAFFFGAVAAFGLITQLSLVASTLHSISKSDISSQHRIPLFVMIYITFAFVLTLPMTMQNGFYIVNILDTYVGGILLPITTLYEVVALVWIYGSHNICRDFEFMRGGPPRRLTVFCWAFVCPATLLFVSSYPALSKTSNLRLTHYVYPLWASVVGWAAVGVGVGTIAVGFWAVYRDNGKVVKNAANPREDWGPRDPVLLGMYKSYRRAPLRASLVQAANSAEIEVKQAGPHGGSNIQ